MNKYGNKYIDKYVLNFWKGFGSYQKLGFPNMALGDNTQTQVPLAWHLQVPYCHSCRRQQTPPWPTPQCLLEQDHDCQQACLARTEEDPD